VGPPVPATGYHGPRVVAAHGGIVKNTIASTEFYGVAPGGERKRLTVAVGTPVRDRYGEGWRCKVAIADVLQPTGIAGADSFEALARAVARVRQHLTGLQEEGWEFSLDRSGREVLDLESWFWPPG
jgi:hypothetical protein